MGGRNFSEVLVLGDHREAVLDSCCGNERIEHARSETRSAAVVHEPRKRAHHGLADGNWVSGSDECERVSPLFPVSVTGCRQNPELKLPHGDDRHGELGRKLTERPTALCRNEHGGVREATH